jgi:single-strand DNA-binding protein
MNVLNAIGNVSRDAEIRYTPNGDAIASFSFALNSGYGDKQITTWLNCSIWGKRAETLAPMILKGSKIGITGELTNRPYTAKDGTEKYSLDVRVNDVTLLGAKPANQSAAPSHMNADADPEIPF